MRFPIIFPLGQNHRRRSHSCACRQQQLRYHYDVTILASELRCCMETGVCRQHYSMNNRKPYFLLLSELETVGHTICYILVPKKWRFEGKRIHKLREQRPKIICIERIGDVTMSDQTEQELERLNEKVRREHEYCGHNFVYPLLLSGPSKVIVTNYPYSQQSMTHLRYICTILVCLGFSWPVKAVLDHLMDLTHVECIEKYHVEEVTCPEAEN